MFAAAAIALALHGGGAMSQESRLLDDFDLGALLDEVDRSYVDAPSYRAMFLGALEAVAKLAPGAGLQIESVTHEIAISYDARNGTRARMVFTAPETRSTLREVLQRLASLAADELVTAQPSQQIQPAIFAGALLGLDPHCDYVEPPTRPPGFFAGIGLELGQDEEGLRVIFPIEGAPAALGGVRRGDLILRIDDKPVKGLALKEAVELLRGRPDTPVALTIVRGGESASFTITLKRQPIRFNEVKARVIEPGYGWIHLSRFEATTPERLARQLESLLGRDDIKGLVLDLRNNSGGLLHSAVGVAAAFLPPQAVVFSSDGRAEDAKRSFRADARDYLPASGPDPLRKLPAAAKTVPMVVLVNGGTASGPEIVAAALQDHRRATIAGTRTFGMGNIQTLFPMRDRNAAVKVTTARVYTPAGHSFQAVGVIPDLPVEDPNDTAARPREADLPRHLTSKADASETWTPTQTAPLPERRFAGLPTELGSPQDVQLERAIDFLKGKAK